MPSADQRAARAARIRKRQAVRALIHFPQGDEGTFIGSQVYMDLVAPHLISVGRHVTITKGVMILTHDALGQRVDRKSKYGRVIIEDHVAIGVGAIILPGTRIQKGSIVAAGAVITSGTDIPPGEVWGGNPGHRICSVEQYRKKRSSIRVLSDRELVQMKAKDQGREILKPLELVLWGPPEETSRC